jgi:hypothetical protein
VTYAATRCVARNFEGEYNLQRYSPSYPISRGRLYNSGSSAVDVSCPAFGQTLGNYGGVTGAVYVDDYLYPSSPVSCTLKVTGAAGYAPSGLTLDSQTKTSSGGIGGEQLSFDLDISNTIAARLFFNYTCNLPPGVALTSYNVYER